MLLRRTLPRGSSSLYTKKPPAAKAVGAFLRSISKRRERDTLTSFETAMPILPKLMLRRTLPRGSSSLYTKKPPAAKAVGAFLRSISKRRERDTLTSFETAMPILPKLMLRRTLPRGFSSLYTKKPPAAKAVGAFLRSISKRRERDSNPRTAYAV